MSLLARLGECDWTQGTITKAVYWGSIDRAKNTPLAMIATQTE